MTTLDFLQRRASIPAKFLSEPAPSATELTDIIKAAVAAPDHANLKPWRFIIIKGSSRKKLGEVFMQATRLREPNMDEEKIKRQGEKPLRSPMIMAVVCKITKNHPKAPELEQLLSAAAAMQQAQLAANALGYGAIWLTGPNAFDAHVKSALKVDEKDQIIGFLYLGTSSIASPKVKRPDPNTFVEYW
jgi:nitroreductase